MQEENQAEKPILSESDSGSESDSSVTESESEVESQTQASESKVLTQDDDNDEEIAHGATVYLQTKNEVVDTPITIPDLEEVGIDEELEKVGEVLSIIGDMVIVRGLPSGFTNRGSERALDSDTLLVFGDRRVLGYIYETFGPTSQPLYQIKFNQQYPLDPEKVQVGREVFYVQERSHFIFVNLLKQFKGSDASNVHDEEPGEDEIEFSDDEAEAAYRSHLKHKRGRERSKSVSSKYSTPIPSQMPDQDMTRESVLNKNAFDDYGPYDLDYGAGPSRPTPKPYDDPYSDAYSPSQADYNAGVEESLGRSNTAKDKGSTRSSEGRGHRRGRGTGGRGTKGRGTGGRGTGNQFNNHSRVSFGDHRQPHLAALNADTEAYDPRLPQESLPTPFMPAENSHAFHFSPSMNMNPSWGYPGSSFGHLQNRQLHMLANQQASYVPSSTFVQPHINPRFASAFGFQLPPGANLPTPAPIPQDQALTEPWIIPATNSSEPESKEPDARTLSSAI